MFASVGRLLRMTGVVSELRLTQFVTTTIYNPLSASLKVMVLLRIQTECLTN